VRQTMLRRTTWMLAAAVALAVLFTPAWAGEKPRIAVISFENKAGWGGYRLGDQAADMLVTQLVKTKAFRVMERDQLDAVLKEQNLGASGRVDTSTAAKMGKILGVKYIIIGAVTQFGKSEAGASGFAFRVRRDKYSGKVDVRMVDVETGEIVDVWEEESEAANVRVSVFGQGGGAGYDEKIAHEVLQDAINKIAKQIAASVKS